MANGSEKIDTEKAKETAEHVFDLLGGALVSAMIYLGDRMGLYQALSGSGAVTSEALAQKTGLHNRSVERLLAPWFRTQIVPSALPKLVDGVVRRSILASAASRFTSGRRRQSSRCSPRAWPIITRRGND
jgi:hypothetical protein